MVGQQPMVAPDAQATMFLDGSVCWTVIGLWAVRDDSHDRNTVGNNKKNDKLKKTGVVCSH